MLDGAIASSDSGRLESKSSDTHPSCLQTPTTGLFVDNWPWIDRLLVPLSERLLPRWRANHSEDCLTLNVQAPPPGRAGLSPVLFWIHGGSYLAGSGSDKPASELCAGAGAEEPVVFVSFNYRLGVFGALGSCDRLCASWRWYASATRATSTVEVAQGGGDD